MSGRRAKALRKKFREETGRSANQREQRWLKSFYRGRGDMDFGFRPVEPPVMSVPKNLTSEIA